jgi:hypothetical protein
MAEHPAGINPSRHTAKSAGEARAAAGRGAAKERPRGWISPLELKHRLRRANAHFG